MLLLVLQNSSSTLQNAPPFISLIKRDLCVSLSRNAVSSNVQVGLVCSFQQLRYKEEDNLLPFSPRSLSWAWTQVQLTTLVSD